MKTMNVINPATGALGERYDVMSPADVSASIDRAHQAFLAWRTTSFEHRAEKMRRAAVILRERVASYAERMVLEMGKPIREARAEVLKCAWVCEYYAENAETFLASRDIKTDARESFVSHQPIGVVLAVMPWNFPLWQVCRFVAPGLMAGNAGVLKHASNVPGCALAIAEILRDAGFPPDLFQTLLIGSEQVAAVIEHKKIRAVTLTGSTPAGRAVAAKAGEHLKKTVLELGGSDPYVILADADLEQAVKACAISRFLNSGQSCIAAKRFIVVDEIYDAFVARFVEVARGYVMGDPSDEATDIGPQARVDLRDELHQQVRRSLDAGARCLLGGAIPPRPGAFYPPTVLVDVSAGMPAYEEELFGPVAAIIRATSAEDALRIANDSDFGLGAAVFTADLTRGRQIAEEVLEAGCCFVNAFVRSDPRLPFGGIKTSGYGRELGRVGILEFVNIKTVYVA